MILCCIFIDTFFQEAKSNESDEDTSNSTSRPDDKANNPNNPHTNSVSIQTEDTFLHVSDVSTQTEKTVSLMSTAVQTDISILPNCYQVNAAIQCDIGEDIDKENIVQVDVTCEGNNDEKFYPLVEKNKGIFKDVSG